MHIILLTTLRTARDGNEKKVSENISEKIKDGGKG